MSELKEHLFCECDEFVSEYRGQLSNKMRPYYLKSEADKVIAELKEQVQEERSAKVDYKISSRDLSGGLKEAQAELRRYAKMVEQLKANLDRQEGANRRLKRALYKACANWAHHRVFVRFKTNEKAWENVERKCLEKEEAFK